MYLQDLSSNINIKENEKKFQESFDSYWNSTDPVIRKKSWEAMWWCVFYTCSNIAKSIYKRRGVTVSDERLEEVIVDGTAYCLKFIGKGVRPSKLSSYCFLRVRRFIDDPKTVWYDMHIVQFPEDKYKEGKDMEMSNNNIYEERYE